MKPAWNSATRGLYALVDVDVLQGGSLSAPEAVRAVLAGAPIAVQLRAKHLDPRNTLELLRAIQPDCARAGVALFNNDRPDLAQLAGCDGVHVGQGDLPVSEVRRCFPALAIGVSTHDEAQLRAACGVAPDYIAYGPVYPTRSKELPDPTVGIQGLARASELLRGAFPLVAIGGITLERAPEVARLGAIGAVIGALLGGELSASELTQRTLAFGMALGGRAGSEVT